MDYSNEVNRFVTWLIDNPGKEKSIVASNPSGVLWTTTWKFIAEEKKFFRLLESPGFVYPLTTDGSLAVKLIASDIESAQTQSY